MRRCGKEAPTAPRRPARPGPPESSSRCGGSGPRSFDGSRLRFLMLPGADWRAGQQRQIRPQYLRSYDDFLCFLAKIWLPPRPHSYQTAGWRRGKVSRWRCALRPPAASSVRAQLPQWRRGQGLQKKIRNIVIQHRACRGGVRPGAGLQHFGGLGRHGPCAADAGMVVRPRPGGLNVQRVGRGRLCRGSVHLSKRITPVGSEHFRRGGRRRGRPRGGAACGAGALAHPVWAVPLHWASKSSIGLRNPPCGRRPAGGGGGGGGGGGRAAQREPHRVASLARLRTQPAAFGHAQVAAMQESVSCKPNRRRRSKSRIWLPVKTSFISGGRAQATPPRRSR